MKRTPLYGFAKIFLQPIFRLFVPSTFQGREHMPQEGKVVVCANHLGLSDPIRLVISQRRQIFFMSKEEFFKNKIIGFIFRKLGAFPVARGKGDVSAINKAGEILQRGDPLGIFIEGTRSKTGEFGPPKSGTVMIAYKNQAPILPVCITPKKGKHPKLFHKCFVSFGELIQPEELGIVKGTGSEFRQASRLIMSRIEEMRERDLNSLHQ